jgi:hypothetical protein
VFSGVDAWLLVELWAVPLILLPGVAWHGGRDGVAAALAFATVATRETSVLLPLGFLAAAWWLRRPVRPWLLALGGGAAVLGLHWWAASSHLYAEGNSAALAGTGSAVAVISMTSYLVLPDWLGLAVWCAGLVLLWRSELRPAVLIALTPLFGLVVNRPYWGFLAMPLCITALGGLPPWPGHAASRTPNPRPRSEATRAP